GHRSKTERNGSFFAESHGNMGDDQQISKRHASSRKRAVDKQFANTLSRGLDILACFQSGETTLSNKDFSIRLDLDKSTVSRLTYTLAQLGYLRQTGARQGFRLG